MQIQHVVEFAQKFIAATLVVKRGKVEAIAIEGGLCHIEVAGNFTVDRGVDFYLQRRRVLIKRILDQNRAAVGVPLVVFGVEQPQNVLVNVYAVVCCL